MSEASEVSGEPTVADESPRASPRPGATAGHKPDILVVEDDRRMRATCVEMFERVGYPVAAVADGPSALDWLQAHGADGILLTDVRMPGMDGLQLLRKVRSRWPTVDVVVMTAFGSVENAVEAMKLGATDYVTKPFSRDEMMLSIERVCRLRGLRARVDELEGGLEERYRFRHLVAGSPAMQDVLHRMAAASRSTASVLLTGESGTGKDLVARTIHFSGRRSARPFVPINCAGLPAELIESELFGHVKGAYTGAEESREGLVRKAHGGTLFLDEITEMSTGTQAKLLRVLQEKVVRPVGGSEELDVDIRVIAASNRDLQEVLERGVLREDLYYRLGVLHIHLPPLRERLEDLPPLLRHFLDAFNEKRSPEEQIRHVEPRALDALRRHRWPGNVRELANLVERCFALGVAGTLRAADVRRELAGAPPPASSSSDVDPESVTPHRGSGDAGPRGGAAASPTAAETDPDGDFPSLVDVERRAIAEALERTDGNKAAAARLLGISRKTLYRKLADDGL